MEQTQRDFGADLEELARWVLPKKATPRLNQQVAAEVDEVYERVSPRRWLPSSAKAIAASAPRGRG